MKFWNSRQERLQEEIQSHIELETAENLRSGMSPEDARRAAQKRFGNALLAIERSREIWGVLWLEHLLQDLRFALRSLRTSPGYAAAVILTLALGFGSVATILAIVDSVLLRPVAIPHPDQLVLLYIADRTGVRGELTESEIQDLQRESRLFAAVAGFDTSIKPVGTSSGTRWANVVEVTPGFFHMLDVRAAIGSLPDANATAPVAVISHDFWQERLGSDPHAIGSLIHLDGEARTVIGVLPRGVSVLSGTGGPFVYTPLTLSSQQAGMTPSGAFVMARIRTGVSIPQALAEARSIFAHSSPQDVTAHRDLAMDTYTGYLTGSLRKPLLVMLGGVLILLLIAFANAANLQIARAMERMTEMHVRSALGASFGRLLQQLLMESVVISLLSGALGCALACVSTSIIRTAYGTQYSRFREIAVHPIVFAAISLLALVTGILASLAPALSIRRGTRAAAAAPFATPRTRISGILVMLQIALSCVLLATAGLFARTFRALEQIPLGFDPHDLTNLVLMPVDSKESPILILQTNARLLERFQSLPGVESAALQSSAPFSVYPPVLTCWTDVSGRPFRKGDSAIYSFVSSDFVRASGIHLLHGRAFTTQDETSPNMVALVNQAFVNEFLPGRNPLGISVRFHREPHPPRPSGLPLDILGILEPEPDVPLKPSFSIVGVIQNELQRSDLGAPFEPMIYLDYQQIPKDSTLLGIMLPVSPFVIRSSLPPVVLDQELRTVLKQVASDMAEMQLATMEDKIAQALGERNLALRLVSSFGAMALLLAAVGIYGMLAYAVTLRRREIGIRMTLGSSRSGVTGLILAQAGWLIFAGVVPGLAAALVAGHAVRSFLFGVQPLDPASLAAAVALLLLAGMVAAVFPAWRAARVDPMEVLRTE